MAVHFPLYVDLKDNNCTVFGGGETAHDAAVTLLQFHAKVTVVSPTLCPALEELDKNGTIRYLRRKYYRGDCSSAYLCVAATDQPAVNIAISDECKNKAIPVAVERPVGFGTFTLPHTVIRDNVVVSVSGTASQARQAFITARLAEILPGLMAEYDSQEKSE